MKGLVEAAWGKLLLFIDKEVTWCVIENAESAIDVYRSTCVWHLV